MSCNLTIAGKDFEISSFLSSTALQVVKTGTKGEPRSPLRPDGEKLSYSFLTIETSKADFSDFNTQVQDTVAYFQTHRQQLSLIKETKGIDQVSLDFGIESSEARISQQIFLPVELIGLAAELGISIQVSIYRGEYYEKLIGRNEVLMNYFSEKVNLLSAEMYKIDIHNCTESEVAIDLYFKLLYADKHHLIRISFKEIEEFSFYHGKKNYFYYVERYTFFRHKDYFYLCLDPSEEAEVISEDDQNFVLAKEVEGYVLQEKDTARL
ncbi:hypothetical protein [Chitinophaga varians]|uniref:hypothetical protein n=1 Tax=Chitinophaga varians TaxID=2202339 RepID=UPI00165F119A|nr:hypothetical protein [Chitinophaga varians]MBC9914020.1 hypothetical protein [Chitinophaga varians]